MTHSIPWRRLIRRTLIVTFTFALACFLMLQCRTQTAEAYARVMISGETAMLRRWGWDMSISEIEEIRQHPVPEILADIPLPLETALLDKAAAAIRACPRSQNKHVLVLFYTDVCHLSPDCVVSSPETTLAGAPAYVHALNSGFAVSCRQALRTTPIHSVASLLVVPVPHDGNPDVRQLRETQLDHLGVRQVPCLLAYPPQENCRTSSPDPILLAVPVSSTYRTIINNAEQVSSRLAALNSTAAASATPTPP